MSLAEDVRAYKYENGRSYHSYQEGKYVLPNDEQEKERLDFMHHLYLIWLDGELLLAPVRGEELHRVLDVGTGTGIWAMEFSHRFPNAKVIGNDLSPIQPIYVYPNVRFEVDDVELEWPHPPNYFDLIHIRCMSGFIRDWDFLLKQAFLCVKPGGYIEFQDGSNDLHIEGTSVPDHETPLQQWVRLLHEASEIAGTPMKVGYVMKELLERAGFVDIVETLQDWPYGTWKEDNKLKYIGKLTIAAVLDSLSSYAMGFLTRHLGWKRSEVDILCAKASAQLKQGGFGPNSPVRFYSRSYFVYARKPQVLQE